MPTAQEIDDKRKKDERRAHDEHASATVARRSVLRQRQLQIAQQKIDLERESREIVKELGALH